MRKVHCWSLAALGAMTLAGCHHRDLVEAELRYRNRQVRELRRDLAQKQAEVHTLQSMLNPAGSSCPSGETGAETPETVYRREAMSRVSLAMSTGVRDVDRDGVEDSIQFTVVCHDYDGDAFKCPGQADLELHAVQESGVVKPVSHWQMEPDRLRATWKASLLSNGYQIIVPAPTLSQSKRWKAIVRFTTLDGRVFQDERTFDYRPKGITAPEKCSPAQDILPAPPVSTPPSPEPPLPEPEPPAPLSTESLDEPVIELPLPTEPKS